MIAQAAALVVDARDRCSSTARRAKTAPGRLSRCCCSQRASKKGVVIADYLATGAHMDGVLSRIAADPDVAESTGDISRLRRERPELLGVSERAIRAVIEHVREAGGAALWLLEHGLAEPQLEALRRRLGERLSILPSDAVLLGIPGLVVFSAADRVRNADPCGRRRRRAARHRHGN